ncbi:MAG TPA: hypothetical protein V6D19_04195 [Stenomitos sp.]
MKTTLQSDLACRLCQHFAPEGRRGGTCQALDVPVHGEWNACPLLKLQFSQCPERVTVLSPPKPVLPQPVALQDSYPLSA